MVKVLILETNGPHMLFPYLTFARTPYVNTKFVFTTLLNRRIFRPTIITTTSPSKSIIKICQPLIIYYTYSSQLSQNLSNFYFSLLKLIKKNNVL